MNDKQKTETILEALKRKCTSWHRCNVLFPELRLGSGYSDIAQRRIDLFMISAEKGNYTTAFEIKVSRADFLKDIKNDLKQRGARLYSSNFYYVTPKGMLKPDEIPMWAGLIEYDFDEKQFQEIIPAPLQNRNNPSWSLICSLIRRINKSLYTTKLEDKENLCDYYKKKSDKAENILKQIANNEIKEEYIPIVLAKYKSIFLL